MKEPEGRLDPALAGVIALFVPGLAHLLLGRTGRGAMWLGLIAGFVTTIVLAPQLIGGDPPAKGFGGLFEGLLELLVQSAAVLVVWTAAGVATIAVWIAQLVDAVRCARDPEVATAAGRPPSRVPPISAWRAEREERAERAERTERVDRMEQADAPISAWRAERAEQAAAPATIQRVAGPQHCPFCHERVEDGPGVVCAGCLARHHGDCWGEGGKKCSACGGRSRMVAADDSSPAAPPATTPEDSPDGWRPAARDAIRLDE